MEKNRSSTSPASLEALKRSYFENPCDPERCFQLGKALREAGDCEEAEKILVQALGPQHEPCGPDWIKKIQQERALCLLAIGKKMKKKDPEEALDCFQIAVEYDPDLITAWRYITSMHLNSAIAGWKNIHRLEVQSKRKG